MRTFLNIIIITERKGDKNRLVILGSGLNCIFWWKFHSLSFSESKSSSFIDLFTSSTFEKREVSSSKILHIDVIPSGRSFMYII